MLNTNRACRSRRGMALLYVTMTLSLMIGFASLAVDLARVQLVKTELQSAADAAARHGASGVMTGAATARSNATTVAAENQANGSPVVLTAADVVCGYWNTTAFTFTANGSPMNAVRVTASRTASRGTALPLTWAKLLPGVGDSMDITATAVAYAAPQTFKGFVGLESFAAKNNSVGASYNSSVTTSPTIASATSNGMFGTNGLMDGKNNSQIRGNLYLGPAGTNDGLSVTGSTVKLSTSIPTPSVPTYTPVTNPGSISQSYSVGTATLPGGTYWFTSLTVTGTLAFSGPTTLYVNGNVNLSGKLLASGLVPSNLRVYVIGSNRTVGDAGANDVDICAQFIAPGAALVAKNNFGFRGWGYFKSIDTKNDAEYYYDEYDGPAGASTPISLVR